LFACRQPSFRLSSPSRSFCEAMANVVIRKMA
jgi:hypothetical protein